LLKRVLKQVRKSPYRGIAYDADGVRHHAVVNGAALVAIAFGATYGPEYYREFPATLRSALHGDREPLLRLVAENVDSSSYAGAPIGYSEGLDAAVSCEDYPQLYNMADPPAKRLQEFKAAVKVEQKQHPNVYAPFTIEEYLHSDWEEADWCLKWPSPEPGHTAGPPMPPSGHYPSVPTLVLSGELDSITTPQEAGFVTAEFPKARHVIIANSFHVTAEDDTDGCASSILRIFVAHPSRRLTSADLRCAKRVPPVRTIGRYRTSFTHLPAATAHAGNGVDTIGRRAATASAETVADLLDRWFNNYTGHGVGLYGGTWTYGGDHTITFHLKNVRLERNLAVSGKITWKRYQSQLACELTVRRVTPSGHPATGTSVTGTVNGHWNTRRKGAIASLGGDLGGRPLRASMLAP
jgi:pimeloyl-ACP methyl ester carboxylesterase